MPSDSMNVEALLDQCDPDSWKHVRRAADELDAVVEEYVRDYEMEWEDEKGPEVC